MTFKHFGLVSNLNLFLMVSRETPLIVNQSFESIQPLVIYVIHESIFDFKIYKIENVCKYLTHH